MKRKSRNPRALDYRDHDHAVYARYYDDGALVTRVTVAHPPERIPCQDARDLTQQADAILALAGYDRDGTHRLAPSEPLQTYAERIAERQIGACPDTDYCTTYTDPTTGHDRTVHHCDEAHHAAARWDALAQSGYVAATQPPALLEHAKTLWERGRLNISAAQTFGPVTHTEPDGTISIYPARTVSKRDRVGEGRPRKYHDENAARVARREKQREAKRAQRERDRAALDAQRVSHGTLGLYRGRHNLSREMAEHDA